MVEVDRAQIKTELIARAEQLFSQWDQLDVVAEDPEKQFIAKQTFSDEGLGITIAEMTVPGLTREHLQPWLDDPLATMMVLNNRVERFELPDHDGHKMWRMKMNMPLVISNRAIVTCIYRAELDDGFSALFHSGRGNEAFIESCMEEIGSDVIADMQINFTAFKEVDGGIKLK